MGFQEVALLGCDGGNARRARDDGGLAVALAEFRPQLLQRRGYFAGMLAPRHVGDDVDEARKRLCAARFGVCFRLNDEKRAARPKRKAAGVAAPTERRKLVFEIEAAEFVENQQILAFTVWRPADQGDVALAGGD